MNGECLWVESCEIDDIVALQDTIVDACLLNWRDIVRAAKEANE